MKKVFMLIVSLAMGNVYAQNPVSFTLLNEASPLDPLSDQTTFLQSNEKLTVVDLGSQPIKVWQSSNLGLSFIPLDLEKLLGFPLSQISAVKLFPMDTKGAVLGVQKTSSGTSIFLPLQMDLIGTQPISVDSQLNSIVDLNSGINSLNFLIKNSGNYEWIIASTPNRVTKVGSFPIPSSTHTVKMNTKGFSSVDFQIDLLVLGTPGKFVNYQEGSNGLENKFELPLYAPLGIQRGRSGNLLIFRSDGIEIRGSDNPTKVLKSWNSPHTWDSFSPLEKGNGNTFKLTSGPLVDWVTWKDDLLDFHSVTFPLDASLTQFLPVYIGNNRGILSIGPGKLEIQGFNPLSGPKTPIPITLVNPDNYDLGTWTLVYSESRNIWFFKPKEKVDAINGPLVKLLQYDQTLEIRTLDPLVEFPGFFSDDGFKTLEHNQKVPRDIKYSAGTRNFILRPDGRIFEVKK